MSVLVFEPGGYRFIPSVFQYSAGVAAEPGYEIRRVRFKKPIPLAEGLARAEAIIKEAGRPMTAFCSCELRSPAPFSEAEFLAFNQVYVGTLERWGLLDGEANPVARSHLIPEITKPAEPSLYAFSFTVPAQNAAPTFIIAGSAEVSEGDPNYLSRMIRPNDTSPEAMREKAIFVHNELEARMAELGFVWPDATATHVYTVQNFHPYMADELVRRGAALSGINWQFNRPPVMGLEYEMDCRAINWETVLA